MKTQKTRGNISDTQDESVIQERIESLQEELEKLDLEMMGENIPELRKERSALQKEYNQLKSILRD